MMRSCTVWLRTTVRPTYPTGRTRQVEVGVIEHIKLDSIYWGKPWQRTRWGILQCSGRRVHLESLSGRRRSSWMGRPASGQLAHQTSSRTSRRARDFGSR